MSELYSFKGSYPYPLPTNMNGYNINDFVLAPEKPTLNPGQVLEWISNSWSVREANEAELAIKWQEVRTQRNTLLADTDSKILKYLEVGQAVPENTVAYRQALRDIPQNQTDPFAIVWPTE